MNRKAYASILALIFLAVVFLPGCNNSSSKPPVQSIAVSSGSPQTVADDTAFAPLVAVVTANGVPVSGVSVTFAAPAAGSGASGTFASNSTNTETDTTDANGLATASTFTANTTPGAFTVTATITGVAQPANFLLTNTATLGSVTATSGQGQSAVVLTAFTNPLVATVLDTNSNPVAGVSVVFTAPATGASATFASTSTNTETDTTDVNGNATSSAFTANALAGGYSVTAAVTGVTPSATFAETNTAGGTVEGIAPLSGTPQSAVISTAFTAPLIAEVTIGGVPQSGVSVTFTAPALTGASGTFASNGTITETDLTDVNGNATSSVFTANATTGSYQVAATVTGVTAAANFNLTNTAAPTSFSYVFYLTGAEVTNPVPVGPNFYALAGAVTIGTDGTVAAGEQDYNDGDGNTSPQPSGDTITGGTLTLSTTVPGQATLTLITNNTALGVAGTETLGVQFVNANHALIVQFDGSATSSGSLDLQTPSSGSNTDYAFTYSGTDTGYLPEVFGGIFSISSNAVSGVYDENDAGTVTLNTAFSATTTSPDSFGRGTVTGTPLATTLVYYVVGPEVMRFIGVDPDLGDAGVGSAFGQGASAGNFTNASVPTSVFSASSTTLGNPYAGAGVIVTTPNGANDSFTGTADDNAVGVLDSDVSIAGTIYINPSGYCGLAINPGINMTAVGLYLTDPNLNLNDPNNPVGGGGGLIADMDGSGIVSTGVLTPQTDATSADFTGNYAFGAQAFIPGVEEFDFVGQGAVASLALTGTGLVSDPFTFFTGDTATNSAVPFAGTAVPDGVTAGRYTIPLVITLGTTPFTESAVIYQASGGQLTWVGADDTDVLLGSLEQQGSLTGIPAAKKAVAKTTKKKTK